MCCHKTSLNQFNDRIQNDLALDYLERYMIEFRRKSRDSNPAT